MKKIFTCISLAAATFMATTPVMAQQQKQISDQEKVAFVKAAVPAIFDQVKQIIHTAHMFDYLRQLVSDGNKLLQLEHPEEIPIGTFIKYLAEVDE